MSSASGSAAAASGPSAPRARPLAASAVGLVIGAVFCFALVDGTVKSLSAHYPVAVLVWGRWGVQALAMLVWWGPRMGRGLLRTAHPVVQLVRGAILIGSSVLFVSALRFLPLADATALNYSTPALVVLLAFFVLHEHLTRPRIAFLIAGVIGMALIVRPGASLFHGAALLALAAAACYATFQILTRRLAGEDARVLLFYPALVGTLLLTAFMPWRLLPVAPPWPDLLLMVAAGLLGTIGHFLFILAFQRAPASAVTPFTYVHLVWATLVGWVVFGDLPDLLTVLGMIVIAGSGLLLTLHERRNVVAAPEPPTID